MAGNFILLKKANTSNASPNGVPFLKTCIDVCSGSIVKPKRVQSSGEFYPVLKFLFQKHFIRKLILMYFKPIVIAPIFCFGRLDTNRRFDFSIQANHAAGNRAGDSQYFRKVA